MDRRPPPTPAERAALDLIEVVLKQTIKTTEDLMEEPALAGRGRTEVDRARHYLTLALGLVRAA